MGWFADYTERRASLGPNPALFFRAEQCSALQIDPLGKSALNSPRRALSFRHASAPHGFAFAWLAVGGVRR
jgi:hypothetical protein